MHQRLYGTLAVVSLDMQQQLPLVRTVSKRQHTSQHINQDNIVSKLDIPDRLTWPLTSSGHYTSTTTAHQTTFVHPANDDTTQPKAFFQIQPETKLPIVDFAIYRLDFSSIGISIHSNSNSWKDNLPGTFVFCPIARR